MCGISQGEIPNLPPPRNRLCPSETTYADAERIVEKSLLWKDLKFEKSIDIETSVQTLYLSMAVGKRVMMAPVAAKLHAHRRFPTQAKLSLSASFIP